MITDLSVFILGIISERPTNPYEIAKYAEDVSMQNWLQAPKQSIYSSIKVLEKNGYITGERIKAGNYPDKTVYSITEDGNLIFVKSLEKFLGNMQWNYIQFNLASIFLCHVERENVIKILNEKMELLNQKARSLERGYEEILRQGIPETGAHAIRHMQLLTKTEFQSVEELMKVIQKETKWNHFFAVDSNVQRRG